MRWFKKDRWKLGIPLAGLLLILVFIVLIPLSASAQEGTPGGVIAESVQTAPTVDVTATMTALNEEKLRNENDWWWSNGASILTGVLATLVVVIGGLIGLFRWFGDRRDAHEKDLRAQAEERFKSAVTALGDENEATQVGGAILLRSFLNPVDKEIYGRYYIQIFDLTVAYLRLLNTSPPSEDADGPLPLTPLRRALIIVFKEVFPLARNRLKEQEPRAEYIPHSLDATGIRLDNAYLGEVDLEQSWIRQVCLQESYLGGANFKYANLFGADLSRTNLGGANLEGTNLFRANLREANLHGVRFSEVTVLGEATLCGANIMKTNLEEVQSLKGTDLRGVKELTREQLVAYKVKGAIVDEDVPTPSSSAPAESTNAQAPTVPPAQATTPPISTGGNSSTPAQPTTEP